MYFTVDDYSQVTVKNIKNAYPYYDGILFRTKNNNMNVYISVDHYEGSKVNIWFEIFNRDYNSQSYEYTLEKISKLTNKFLQNELKDEIKRVLLEITESIEDDINSL